MARLLGVAAWVLSSLMSSGCAYVTAVPSVHGRAFVVKASPFGSSMWNCDASHGWPVCYRTTKVPLAN
jgi:hypothetical protein